MMKFYINPYDGVPIYRQIIRQVKMGIATGTLKKGDRLPPVREMSIELSVNPNTVAKAYRELEREGVTETFVGRGTFIRGKKNVPGEDKIDALIDMLLIEAFNAGYSKEEIINKINKKGGIR